MRRLPSPIAAALSLVFALTAPLLAQSSNAASPSPPPANGGAANPTRSVVALPLPAAIQVDGRLDEAAWAAATVATDFRQFDPQNGEPGTQRTEVRFAFDADAFYVGARMYDDQGAAGVRSRLGRRDAHMSGDNLQLVFDTFHDHTGRTIFTVFPSGVKGDAGQAAPNADPGWDPIWDLATQVDSLGWTAELRIPFAQLRYGAAEVQTWGVQVWRYIERLNETQMWAHWRKDETGGPQLFGHIEDIRVPPKKLGIELMPYALARTDRVQVAAGNPFTDGRESSWRVGGDVKAMLSSSLTLDATINPDFGQVEVDPAVVNLTAFETFFPEKRPFFVEGSGLFSFGGATCMMCVNLQGLSLFYSRRIGRQPQGSLEGEADFEDRPDNTTILGAAKVTGRTQGGLQLGLLNAVTASERAQGRVLGGDGFEQEVEPLTNYFVGRVKKNALAGNLQVGGMATSVVRSFGGDNASLEGLLPAHAEAIGTDFSYTWANRRYNLRGNFAFSQVTGDSAALLRIQRGSARYFQRPDREQGGNGILSDRYDPGMTSMRGFGGYARVGDQTGLWMWEVMTDFRTPGFEINDLAFSTRSDYGRVTANLARAQTNPGRYGRRWDIVAGASQQYNFDGDVTDRELHVWMGRETNSNGMNTGMFIWWPDRLDDRLTRGGAVVARKDSWMANAAMSTDSRKPVVLFLNAQGGHQNDASNYSLGASIEFKPLPNVTLEVGPDWSTGRSELQYVGALADPTAQAFYGRRAMFAGIEQSMLSMNTRLSAVFSPTLSLEFFAQPFIATGRYDAFKEFVRPRAAQTREFDATQLSAQQNAEGRVTQYVIDPDRDAATPNFTLTNPDFNVRSLRGNAVLKWEYRPGSTLYLVWQQQREGSLTDGTFDLGRDVGGVFNARPDNIFVVKLSYWLGL